MASLAFSSVKPRSAGLCGVPSLVQRSKLWFIALQCEPKVFADVNNCHMGHFTNMAPASTNGGNCATFLLGSTDDALDRN